MKYAKLLLLFSFLLPISTMASTIEIMVYKILPNTDTQGVLMGKVVATDTPYGLLLTPEIQGLSPGIHGFHIHENPSCAKSGMAAGGHLDPKRTNEHLGPYNNQGHLGDLPALTADKDELATLPILAPRLTVSDIKGHSLMLHAGGDNYSNDPPMGGGGARIACGVITQ